ncbi:hypothetical protein EDD22DRAFT_198293 [Suillus occidentalis]|nr:hypothetical protein EDD22DRAFT_198293 [Suillus occidentalis]
MNEDKKEVAQTRVECVNFKSVQTATINSQNCESQFVDRPRQSIAARLFGIGVVSLLLFPLFTVTHPGSNIVRSISDCYKISTALNEPGHPDPSDGAVIRCIGSTEWDEYYESPSWAQQFPFGSESLFTLPVGSDSLYLISRGGFRYGHVTVEQSTDVSDDVIVRVRAAYFKEKAFERANVCRLERQKTQNGIGIYTSNSWIPGSDDKDLLMFDVTLTLPASANEDALYIKSLETFAPLFSHKVAALSDTVFFGSISLSTTNSPINVQSVAAETGIFATANGLIKGHFHSTSSLKLITANMAIDAHVDLFHNESAKPSELVMTTTNAPLDARVSLTTASGYTGEFGVDVQTANAPLILAYVDSPVYSQLNSMARTTNAPATVHLHSAFEGSFSVSSFIGPSLEPHRVEDPAGKGRERHVTSSRSRGLIQGSVRWVGGERSGTGLVQVSTTLSPAKLIL